MMINNPPQPNAAVSISCNLKLLGLLLTQDKFQISDTIITSNKYTFYKKFRQHFIFPVPFIALKHIQLCASVGCLSGSEQNHCRILSLNNVSTFQFSANHQSLSYGFLGHSYEAKCHRTEKGHQEGSKNASLQQGVSPYIDSYTPKNYLPFNTCKIREVLLVDYTRLSFLNQNMDY